MLSVGSLVTTEGWTRFCGYELRQSTGVGYLLRQAGYLQDILSRREVKGIETSSSPKGGGCSRTRRATTARP